MTLGDRVALWGSFAASGKKNGRKQEENRAAQKGSYAASGKRNKRNKRNNITYATNNS